MREADRSVEVLLEHIEAELAKGTQAAAPPAGPNPAAQPTVPNAAPTESKADDAPPKPARPLKGEPGFRSAKDVAKELKQAAQAGGGDSLVAKFLPLIDTVEYQSEQHVGLISTGALKIAASEMRRLPPARGVAVRRCDRLGFRARHRLPQRPRPKPFMPVRGQTGLFWVESP